jgi:hypothetical protein
MKLSEPWTCCLPEYWRDDFHIDITMIAVQYFSNATAVPPLFWRVMRTGAPLFTFQLVTCAAENPMPEPSCQKMRIPSGLLQRGGGFLTRPCGGH